MRFSPPAAISLQVLIIKELQDVEDARADHNAGGRNGSRKTSLDGPPPVSQEYCTREIIKVNSDFGKEQAELARDCKAKKMNSLLVLSNNLTNMHSTCILRFELGLEREN
jgi:hypothetical protein